MKRWVQFDRPGIVELVGRYGNIKGHWEAKPEYTTAHPQLELEINAPGDTYAFNGVEFSVCAGGGVLHYKDYPKQLNFINLDVDLLDRYLTTQQMPQNAAQQELIKAFIAITELNAAHGYAYLIPPYFDVLEYALLGGVWVFSVNSALNVIRSRLKDQNYRDLRFSDAEILDAINTIAAQLIVEFKLNKAQQTRQIGPNNRSIHCPHLLCVLEAKFNNSILFSRTDLDNAKEFSLLVQGDKLSVSPFASGTLNVIYCAYEPLSDVAEFLPLPSIASQAVVYGTLALLLEIPTDEQNFNKIGVLKNLYHEAKNLLAMHLNSLFSRAQNCQSRVVRV